MSTLVIGVAGGTGSGKTTVAQHLRAALPVGRVTILQHDAYYRHRTDLSFEERAALNFDHPNSLETPLLVEHVQTLAGGDPVEVPIYDFETHSRREDTRHVDPSAVIVIEGILVLAEKALRDLCDIKVFVDTDSDIRVFRRIRRDMEKRGRDFDSVRNQYYGTVRPMHLRFVEPSKRWADIIIPEGGENRVALDLLVTKIRSVAS